MLSELVKNLVDYWSRFRHRQEPSPNLEAIRAKATIEAHLRGIRFDRERDARIAGYITTWSAAQRKARFRVVERA